MLSCIHQRMLPMLSDIVEIDKCVRWIFGGIKSLMATQSASPLLELAHNRCEMWLQPRECQSTSPWTIQDSLSLVVAKKYKLHWAYTKCDLRVALLISFNRLQIWFWRDWSRTDTKSPNTWHDFFIEAHKNNPISNSSGFNLDPWKIDFPVKT